MNDILTGILIGAVCCSVSLFDSSTLYHSIRSQSTLKLYVIFNVLEVMDKLFSSFGLDLLEAFFSQPPKNSSVLFKFALCFIYIRKIEKPCKNFTTFRF